MAKIIRDGGQLKYVFEYAITADEIKYLLNGGTYAGGSYSVDTKLEVTDENIGKVLEALISRDIREPDEDYTTEEIYCEVVQEAINEVEASLGITRESDNDEDEDEEE